MDKFTNEQEVEIKQFAEKYSIHVNKLKGLINSKAKTTQIEELWPLSKQWCRENKELQKLFRKYKYLVPILNELKNTKAVQKDENHRVGVEPITEYGEEKVYVLLDLSSKREHIADRADCSKTTVSHYINGLVKCGLMEPFNKGQKTYYAIGYWRLMPSSEDKKEWVPFKGLWLTESSSGKLKSFKPTR